MTLLLPVNDQHMTYNVSNGERVKELVDSNQIKMKTTKKPVIITDSKDYMNERYIDFISGEDLRPEYLFLEVKNTLKDKVISCRPVLTKSKTVELARKCIHQFGKKEAETRVMSTETGALYWNILHHFGSFDDCLMVIDSK